MLHRCGEDRICHDVPSYGRNRIGTKGKQRKGDPEWIDGSGGRYRWGNPHDSGQEDGNESTQSEGGHKWVMRGPECHCEVGYVGQHHEEWGRNDLPYQCHHHHQRWKCLLQWEEREKEREECYTGCIIKSFLAVHT